MQVYWKDALQESYARKKHKAQMEKWKSKMGINRLAPSFADEKTGGETYDEAPTPIGLSPAVYAVIGTAFVITIAVVAFFLLWKKSKLNWYEKNILEISKDQSEIIRYRTKDDTTSMEDTRSISDRGRTREYHPIVSSRVRTSASHDLAKERDYCKAESIDSGESKPSSRRQSRIYRSLPDLEASISSTSITAPIVPSPDKRISYPDVSDKFFVPKIRTSSLSMFRGFDMTKIDKELYDSRQDSLPTEEQVLGQCGSLQMALSFDPNLSLLTIKLLQAANLLARRTDSPPNPYFKVHLIPPDPSIHSQTYQTKYYKNNRSPELEEEFCFDILAGNLSNCKLEIMVYDYDQYSVDECIGCCWLSMNRIDIPDDPAVKTVFWAEVMPLESNDDGEAVGDILFSISYLSKAQRLIVTIMKARNLMAGEDMNAPPDPCVKVGIYINKKKLKQRRTSVKKATYNPTYNEALTFNIPKNSLCDIALSITVCHETHAFRHSKILGRLDLPLSKCKDLWRAVIRGEDSKARWYGLEKPEKTN